MEFKKKTEPNCLGNACREEVEPTSKGTQSEEEISLITIYEWITFCSMPAQTDICCQCLLQHHNFTVIDSQDQSVGVGGSASPRSASPGSSFIKLKSAINSLVCRQPQ